MVHHSKQMFLLVNDEYAVYFVSVHDTLNLRNACCRENHFRLTGHDVAHGMVEELCLPMFHGPSDVSIGYQSDDTSLFQRDAQSEFSAAYLDDGLT